MKEEEPEHEHNEREGSDSDDEVAPAHVVLFRTARLFATSETARNRSRASLRAGVVWNKAPGDYEHRISPEVLHSPNSIVDLPSDEIRLPTGHQTESNVCRIVD